MRLSYGTKEIQNFWQAQILKTANFSIKSFISSHIWLLQQTKKNFLTNLEQLFFSKVKIIKRPLLPRSSKHQVRQPHHLMVCKIMKMIVLALIWVKINAYQKFHQKVKTDLTKGESNHNSEDARQHSTESSLQQWRFFTWQKSAESNKHCLLYSRQQNVTSNL